LLEEAGITTMDASSLNILQTIRMQPDIPWLHEALQAFPLNDSHVLLKVICAFHAVKPKAVFAQLDYPNIVAGFAGRLLDIPRIVLSFRNYNPTNFAYLNNSEFLPTYRLLARSGAIRFTSNFVASGDDYADWIHIERSRITRVPNAIDPGQFPPVEKSAIKEARESLGLSPEDPVILGVFRLSPEKDPLGFVETVYRVVKAMPNVQAIVAGIGPLQAEMEARIRDYGLERNIRLLGLRNDVNVLMAMASLLLLTSIKEGMPNVVMESQLVGTPVVATKTGATSEIVIEGETGYVRAVGDFDELAEACLALLATPSKASKMGAAARERSLARFPISNLAKQYIAVLD
jgi:glycosyltransferase involved in cell wall biosynthesis